jgi:hypothetical protein
MPTIIYGQNFNITATVINTDRRDINNVLIIPTGIIVFNQGKTTIGVASLISIGMGMSMATITVSSIALGLGDHFITGYYPGDINFLPAVSLPEEEDIISINIGTTTTITASLTSPQIYGTAITFDATVTQNSGAADPTGVVNFDDGLTILDSETLLSGNSIDSTPLTLLVGTHSILANYTGNGFFLPSSSAPIPIIINQATPPISLVSNDNSPAAIYGDIITFTATISPVGSGIDPSGTVIFYNGISQMSGAIALNGAGQGSFSIGTLLVGSYNITAQYSGDPNYIAVTSSILVQVVNKATPPITLISSEQPASLGDNVTFTATVNSVGDGITPTGTITFFDGITAISGPITINGSGVGSMSTTSLAAGAHSITVQYSGDAEYNSNTSTMFTETIITKPRPLVVVTSSLNPSIYNQLVTFTITVSHAGPTPTGTILLFDGVTQLNSTFTLVAGVTTYAISTLSVGAHPITAQYSGDIIYATATSAILTQNVDEVTPTVTLVSNFNPSNYTQLVTFTATVSPVGILGTPTGTIIFKDGGSPISSAIALNGAGQASFAIATLTGGTHNITAAYSGDSNYNLATSNTIPQLVNRIPPPISISASPSTTITYGNTVVFSSTVSAVGIGVTPTGTVTFDDFGSPISGALTLVSGSTSFGTAVLVADPHNITAVYGGDTNYSPVTSNTLIETVNKATQTVIISSNDYPTAHYGDTITFTGSVLYSGSEATPTGTIAFYVGAIIIGSPVSMSGGSASISVPTSGVGTFNVTAEYSGDPNYTPANSSPLSQTVIASTPPISLSSNEQPSFYGDTITFTAIASPVGVGEVPPGNIIFKDPLAISGPITLSGGSASFSIGILNSSPGGVTYGITAAYTDSVDANYSNATSGVLSQTVDQSNPGIVLTVSPNPAKIVSGSINVTFTATLTPRLAGAPPTGTVTFSINGGAVGSGSIVAGVATLVHAFTVAGTFVIRATYNGNTNYLVTLSGAIGEVIN